MKRSIGEYIIVIVRSLWYQVHWKMRHRCRPGPPERDDEGRLYYPCPECSRRGKPSKVDYPGRGYNKVPD
jgi:hypothetical protein